MYNDDDFNNEEEVQNDSSNDTPKGKILDFYYANKKLIWLLGGVLLFIIIVSLFTSGGKEQEPPIVPNLQVSSEESIVSLNNSFRLIASVINVDNAILQWSSSDPTIATVDQTGVVRALKHGTTTITVTYNHTDGKSYSKTCLVTVAEGNPNVKISSASFQDGEVIISVNGEFALPLIITPSDGYVTSFAYTSNDPSIVTVSNDGKIKALKEGKTTVKVSINNNQFNDEIVVNVTNKPVFAQMIVNPISITFQEQLIKMEVGETSQLNYDVLPLNATISNFEWTSSDPTVATIVNGTVKALKVGTTQITVKAMNDVSAIMTVEVVPVNIPVEKIDILSGVNINLNVGSVHSIIPNITPADATNKSITYASTDPSIASVDTNGQITANASGTVTIIATTVDGNKTASITVTVIGNGGGNPGGPGGSGSGGGSGSSGTGSVTLTSNNKALNTSYANVIRESELKQAPTVVTVKYGSGTTDFKYCTYSYNSAVCDPTAGTSVKNGGTFTINKNGVTVIRYVTYGSGGNSSAREQFVRLTGAGSSTGQSAGCYLCSNSYIYYSEGNAPTYCIKQINLNNESACKVYQQNHGNACFTKSGKNYWGAFGSVTGYTYNARYTTSGACTSSTPTSTSATISIYGTTGGSSSSNSCLSSSSTTAFNKNCGSKLSITLKNTDTTKVTNIKYCHITSTASSTCTPSIIWTNGTTKSFSTTGFNGLTFSYTYNGQKKYANYYFTIK